MQTAKFESPKILIADDDAATRLLLRAAMTQWGYEVVEAENGEEAWKILKGDSPPQLLTLDWLMPKLDGISLCHRIGKELHYRPYIIFLTRMTGTENVVQGLEAGADEFILKPFNLTELRIKVFAGERIIQCRHQLDKAAILLHDANAILHDAHVKIDNKSIQKKIINLQEKITKFNNTLLPYLRQNKSVELMEVKSKHMHIDMERMQAFFGNNKAAIQDFIHTFITLSLEQVNQIKNAITKQDAKAAKYYFHLLGGASANSGIVKLSECCGEGEEAANNVNWLTIEKCCYALEVMIEEIQAEEVVNLSS